MDTRTQILEKNFQAIHINGFQGTRTDKVILELGITKGAFYHYFPDKLSMGYAVIDEILYPMYVNSWINLHTYSGNPIDGIVKVIEQIKGYCTDENVAYGCPLNNLIQEMSPLDEGFRKRLNKIIDKEVELIAAAIVKGQIKQQIRKSFVAEDAGYFIIAGIEGSYAMGKSKNSKAVFEASINQLICYLNFLKE
jgi:AcrR family transcriptional regulator